jgi:hypothetical protein
MATSVPVLPFTTGSTRMDSMLLSVLIGASGIATGLIVGWLNAHGFSDPNLTLLVSGMVFSLLAGVVGGAWSYFKQKQAQDSVVERTIAAATSGSIAPEIIHAANPQQLQRIVTAGVAKSPEAEKALTVALNKAQLPPATAAASG